MNNQIKEGVKAFWEGKLGNPYKENSKKYKDWEYGFNRAYFHNLKKVKERESARETA